jgi:hypothetical protein
MAHDGDDYDPGFDRPRRVSGRGRTAVVLIVALVVVPIVLVACCCGGMAWWVWHQTSPTWHDYRPAAGAWTAQFPQPSNRVKTPSRKGLDGRTYDVAECQYGFPPSTFAVYDAPATPAEQAAGLSTLLTITDHWKANTITETYRTDVSNGTTPILAAEYTQGDTTISFKAMIVKDRIYVLTVESPLFDSTDDPVTEFFDRFAPTGTQAP